MRYQKKPNVTLLSKAYLHNTPPEIDPRVEKVIKKKESKFKQFYTQYGPLFIVVHLTTVVLWIYTFFLISKQ